MTGRHQKDRNKGYKSKNLGWKFSKAGKKNNIEKVGKVGQYFLVKID